MTSTFYLTVLVYKLPSFFSFFAVRYSTPPGPLPFPFKDDNIGDAHECNKGLYAPFFRLKRTNVQ